MQLAKTAIAGTMESSDILITLAPAPAGAGIQIDLDSIVEKQFGGQIRREITEALEELAVADARVMAVDKGALGCAIRARVRAAALRSAAESETISFDWGNAR